VLIRGARESDVGKRSRDRKFILNLKAEICVCRLHLYKPSSYSNNQLVYLISFIYQHLTFAPLFTLNGLTLLD